MSPSPHYLYLIYPLLFYDMSKQNSGSFTYLTVAVTLNTYLTVAVTFMELHMKMSTTSTKNKARKAGRNTHEANVHSSEVAHGALESFGGMMQEQS